MYMTISEDVVNDQLGAVLEGGSFVLLETIQRSNYSETSLSIFMGCCVKYITK